MKRKAFGWKLPPEIERRLGDASYGRQRAIFEAGHLLLVLHAPPKADDATREARRVSSHAERRVPVQRRARGRDETDATAEGLSRAVRRPGAGLSAGPEFRIAFQGHRSDRAAAPRGGQCGDAIQSAREHVKEDRFLIGARDEAYEIARDLEFLLADARCALDYRIAHHAEQQAQEMREVAMAQHKLNVLAAITFPLLIVATLFGMNLPHGLEHSSPLFFYLVFSVGLIVGLWVKVWVTGTRGDRR